MLMQSLIALSLVVQATLASVDVRTPLLARPPLGKRAGFIVSESPSMVGNKNNNGKHLKSPSESDSTPISVAALSPSFVSRGIRSACARKKAVVTPREEGEAVPSAATRLRGGSMGPGGGATYPQFPPQVLPAVLEAPPPKERPCTDQLDSCADRNNPHTKSGAAGVQYTAAKERLIEEDQTNVAEGSYDDEDDNRFGGGEVGRSGAVGGIGGMTTRAGSLPSFPRTLPASSSKAASNKKFAWVP